jgi:transcription elongation factor Elf1
MSLRTHKKYMSDLRRTLQEAEIREKERREGRPRKERRIEQRKKLLPEDRVCPICGCVKINSKQWVCKKHYEFLAVCKSCYMKGL